MKSFKSTCILFILVCFSTVTYGQAKYDNSVFVSSSFIVIPQAYVASTPVDVFSIYYQRKLSKSWSVKANLSAWNRYTQRNDLYRNSITGNKAAMYGMRGSYVQDGLGVLANYQMADLFMEYNYKISKRHSINAGLGISYAWGTNMYTDMKYLGTDLYDVKYTSKQEGYFGVVPEVVYNYRFAHDRLNIGADIRCRYYANMPFNEYDLGMHIGFNF